MLEANSIFFLIFAGAAIAFSLFTVFKKNPVNSAFSLVMVFFCFAGIYALMDAHLIATLQIVVYAGAVMVLFIFVIMLLNADVPSLDFGDSSKALRTLGVLIGISLFVSMVMMFQKGLGQPRQEPYSIEFMESIGGNTKALSTLLFTDYLFPFEVTSVLILSGIVATISLAKRNSSKGDQ